MTVRTTVAALAAAAALTAASLGTALPAEAVKRGYGTMGFSGHPTLASCQTYLKRNAIALEQRGYRVVHKSCSNYGYRTYRSFIRYA